MVAVIALFSWNDFHGIWYDDGASDWIVGSIQDRGSGLAGIVSVVQGAVCPYNIASSNWDYWNNEWVSFSSSVMSVTCSQAKSKNHLAGNINELSKWFTKKYIIC